MKKTFVFKLFIIAFSFAIPFLATAQQSIKGHVFDKKNNEALIGATLLVEGTTKACSVDIDGNFHLNLPAGKYNVIASYVSYQTQKIANVVVKANETTELNILMEEASLMLKSVEVVAQRRTDTELSMLKSVRSAVQVVSGISSQQIGKTLDRDASEVVKRVPGVTIQDNRFIVVRGLNQRYNNVWLNNAATPSSETDVKAFSFDAIPSNMIDNLLIFKSGSPEIAAEATGGFIKISTKNIPDENFLHADYGITYNDQTSFKETYRLPSKPLDFLGLGSSARSIPSDVPANLSYGTSVDPNQSALKLSNNWVAQPYTALPNQKISIAFGKKWQFESGAKIGSITSFNYNNSYSTRSNMSNNAYEGFNPTTETLTPLFTYNANMYNNEYKVGLMHNWAFQNTKGTKIEFKNIFNQTGVDKSAITEGWNNNRGAFFKYYSNQYSSRSTYSGQLSGDHLLNEEKASKIDWNLGFAYADRIEPDRQNWSMNKKTLSEQYVYTLPTVSSINELGRLYMNNHEYVSTAATNYEQKLNFGTIESTLKAGQYTEYKTRNLSERSICYKNNNSGFLSDNDINALPFNELFTEANLGKDKVLAVQEMTSKTNSYDAQNILSAGYLAINLPIQRFNIYGGVRAEYNHLLLDGYKDAINPEQVDNSSFHLFPSLNASYKLNQNGLVRIAYARTINRPEFREVSPMLYYDFNEKYAINGNTKLKDALIQNFDVRYETYPTPNETFSVAGFYKHFANPIEMVSVGSGSNFSFQNAVGATNLGVELEMKKSLETLLGLRNFSMTLNASYIYSMVEFENKQSDRSRPLQGQSPVVVNAAIFYQNDKAGWSSSLMYNVMGKRIMVAAQINQGQVQTPDIYEMPRHVIDFTLNKKIGKQLELKFGIKDLLALNFVTQQTYEYVKDGVAKSMDVNNRTYNLGRSISLGASWRF